MSIQKTSAFATIAGLIMGFLMLGVACAEDIAQKNCFTESGVSLEQTRTACTELIRRGGEDLPQAYYDRGIANYQGGYFPEAVQDFGEVIKLAPRSADAYRNRCWSYAALRDDDHALADCDQAILLDPQCGDCWSLRAQVHEDRNELEAALKDIDEGIRQHPERPYYFDLRGRFCEKLKDKGGAVAAYMEAQKLYPHDADAQRALARLSEPP